VKPLANPPRELIEQLFQVLARLKQVGRLAHDLLPPLRQHC
jgi:hypothetical protein